MVDFRFNALPCFEASVAMQKQADAFRGAGGEPPRSLRDLRGLTCPADPAGVAAFHYNP